MTYCLGYMYCYRRDKRIGRPIHIAADGTNVLIGQYILLRLSKDIPVDQYVLMRLSKEISGEQYVLMRLSDKTIRIEGIEDNHIVVVNMYCARDRAAY